LQRIGQVSNSTVYMTLLAALHALLYHYTKQCDQVIGSTTSTRKNPATNQMLGLFLNTIVLRARFAAEDSFTDLAAYVRDVAVGALSNDGIPFAALVNRFVRVRAPGMSPLFQLMFSMDPPFARLDRGWNFTEMDVATGLAKFDLHLQMEDRDTFLLGRFAYSTDLFKKETIYRMTRDWVTVLSRIAADPSQSVTQLASDFPVQEVPSKLAGLFGHKLRAMWSTRG
jgi:non-ribosomal peptide synthetase component F